MDKFGFKAKADLLVEISENLRNQKSIAQFISWLEKEEFQVLYESTKDFQISFALRRDLVLVNRTNSDCIKAKLLRE